MTLVGVLATLPFATCKRSSSTSRFFAGRHRRRYPAKNNNSGSSSDRLQPGKQRGQALADISRSALLS